ncbi:putative membrane protein [Rhodococcus sp. MTM3W5.2]|nr:putative membrane protein [Rhodococcus sp. MTM3W5.2]
MGRLVGIATEVVAPATLITALLFYFGDRRIYWYFDYFGVSSTVLEFSNRDYFMRSVDGLYLPAGVVGVLGLALMWGFVALPRSVRAGAGSAWLALLAAGAGLLLVLNGISDLFWDTWLNRGLTVAPASIIVGVLLLWYAIYQRRQRLSGAGSARRSEAAAVAEWAVIFLVVGLSLFWAVDNYAAAVGRERAAIFASRLGSAPRVVVYSDKQIDLDPNGTTEIHCPAGDLAYPYRYVGLVLILKAGSNYALVPASWTEDTGTAVVLSADATDALRLEFLMPGAASMADRC